MPLPLPTDTPHTRPVTKQYEILNRPLGQGIERRTIWIAVTAGIVWFGLLALLGVPLLWRFGPLLYLAPVSGLVILGTRVDDTGRMRLMSWYDALRARLPRNRRPITNPLMTIPAEANEVLTVQVTTQVAPASASPRGTGPDTRSATSRGSA